MLYHSLFFNISPSCSISLAFTTKRSPSTSSKLSSSNSLYLLFSQVPFQRTIPILSLCKFAVCSTALFYYSNDAVLGRYFTLPSCWHKIFYLSQNSRFQLIIKQSKLVFFSVSYSILYSYIPFQILKILIVDYDYRYGTSPPFPFSQRKFN